MHTSLRFFHIRGDHHDPIDHILHASWRALAPRSTRALVTAALLVPSASLTGCGGADNAAPAGQRFGSSTMAVDAAPAAEIAANYDGVEESASTADEAAGRGREGITAASRGRSLVFTGDMTAVVADTQAAIDTVSGWLVAHGGFVEQLRLAGAQGSQSAALTLRVPQAEYEALRAAVRELADEVTRDESRREDVSARRADMDARLENLRLAEEELRELLSSMRESGAEVASVLEVYRELSAYRGEIEGLEAQLATLEEQVALSTLRLQFQPAPQLAERQARRWQLGRSAHRAWVDLVDGLQAMTEALIYFGIAVLPRLAIGLGLAWLAWLALRPVLRLFRWRPRWPRRRRRAADGGDLGEP